jgi:hypothetical protein
MSWSLVFSGRSQESVVVDKFTVAPLEILVVLMDAAFLSQ